MEQQPLVSPDTQLGAWAGYLNAYTTLIKERGYSPASVQTQVQLIIKFCEWLQKGHTEVHALDEIIVERFLRRHKSADSARRGDAAARHAGLCRIVLNSELGWLHILQSIFSSAARLPVGCRRRKDIVEAAPVS